MWSNSGLPKQGEALVCASFRKYSMNGHWRVSLILDVYLIQRGVTSLFFASQEGHTSVVQLLLEHGAQVDLPDNVRHAFFGIEGLVTVS